MKKINSSIISARNPSTGNFEDITFFTYGIDTELSNTSENAVQNKVVKQAIDNLNSAIQSLPEPMVFKGSLGVNGTITSLPIDGTAAVGDTYKVITNGTYASQSAKVGDTFICLTKTSNSNSWELIPSSDEPSGTVTSVTAGAGLTGGPVTSSGTIKANLKSETQSSLAAASKGAVTNREYAVGLDTNGNLSVNVPWEEIYNAGKTITAGTSQVISGTTYTVGDNAEVFNSYNGNSVNKAIGSYSHAEGNGTITLGTNSHAEGYYTLASSSNQHVQGKYNVEDANDTYAFIIGNGTADNARSNAFAIDWNGLIYVNGAATGVNVATLAADLAALTARVEALENQ